MLFSAAALAMMLAATGQACTRVLVEENWESAQYMTRTLTLWDDVERVESMRLGPVVDERPGIHYIGQGYSVAMDGPDKGPREAWVAYPNGYCTFRTRSQISFLCHPIHPPGTLANTRVQRML